MHLSDFLIAVFFGDALRVLQSVHRFFRKFPHIHDNYLLAVLRLSVPSSPPCTLFREQLAFPQTDGIFVLFFRYIFKPFPLFLNAFHNNFS
jgi:hypothetical protein